MQPNMAAVAIELRSPPRSVPRAIATYPKAGLETRCGHFSLSVAGFSRCSSELAIALGLCKPPVVSQITSPLRTFVVDQP